MSDKAKYLKTYKMLKYQKSKLECPDGDEMAQKLQNDTWAEKHTEEKKLFIYNNSHTITIVEALKAFE